MEKMDLEEVEVTLKNGKKIRIVVEKGLSDAEVYAAAIAQDRGDTDVEGDESDLESQDDRFEDMPPSPTGPTSADATRNRMLYGALGTGAGAAKTGLELGLNVLGRGRDALVRNMADRIAPSVADRVAPRIEPSMSRAPLSAQSDPTARILQGTTGDMGTTGRARQTGYNVQTAQEAARAKQAQGVLDQLRKSGQFPVSAAQDPFARAPGMTSSPSGVLYPRADPAQTSGPRASFVQGQEGLRQIPQRPQVPPTTAPRPSPLSTITQGFLSRAKPGANLLVKYLGPLGGGLTAGMNVGDLVTESQKEQPDYRNVARAGFGTLGGALSMFPATAPIGIPMAIGSELLRPLTEEERRFRDMQATESPFAYGP